MEQLRILKNSFLALIYRILLKPLFFQIDPEQIHDLMVGVGELCGKFRFTGKIIHLLFFYSHPKLKQQIAGITFENPVGLAAGFDKEARLTQIIGNVGFGFIEVGSITLKPYGGNAGTRLWRLKKSEALVVNYGLKNKGAPLLSHRLRKLKFPIPVGTSIAKTNSPETVDENTGIKDYIEGFKYFTKIGDYYTVNISCPNTFGGQPFTDSKKLNRLLTGLDKIPTKKPIFIKFSPDLSFLEVREILDVCRNHRVHGFVISNLTKNRVNPLIKDPDVPSVGGISGRVVRDLSDNLISYVYNYTKGKYILIGVGGIFTAEDAYRKIKNGASLVQLITGMIYRGPQVIAEINRGLADLLEKDGYQNISEAVGTNVIKTWKTLPGPSDPKVRTRRYTESFPGFGHV